MTKDNVQVDKNGKPLRRKNVKAVGSVAMFSEHAIEQAKKEFEQKQKEVDTTK
jgi:hypothetical protein